MISELNGGLSSKSDPSDNLVPLPEFAVTRLGDIWAIGPHRLICGDSTKAETYSLLMTNKLADIIFSDAPYNVKINGHVSGLGKKKHREFAEASGEMSIAEFTQFLTTVFQHLATFSADGSIHYQCMDHRHMREMLDAGFAAYTRDEEFVRLGEKYRWNGFVISLTARTYFCVQIWQSAAGKQCRAW